MIFRNVSLLNFSCKCLNSVRMTVRMMLLWLITLMCFFGQSYLHSTYSTIYALPSLGIVFFKTKLNPSFLLFFLSISLLFQFLFFISFLFPNFSPDILMLLLIFFLQVSYNCLLNLGTL